MTTHNQINSKPLNYLQAMRKDILEKNKEKNCCGGKADLLILYTHIVRSIYVCVFVCFLPRTILLQVRDENKNTKIKKKTIINKKQVYLIFVVAFCFVLFASVIIIDLLFEIIRRAKKGKEKNRKKMIEFWSHREII